MFYFCALFIYFSFFIFGSCSMAYRAKCLIMVRCHRGFMEVYMLGVD